MPTIATSAFTESTSTARRRSCRERSPGSSAGPSAASPLTKRIARRDSAARSFSTQRRSTGTRHGCTTPRGRATHHRLGKRDELSPARRRGRLVRVSDASARRSSHASKPRGGAVARGTPTWKSGIRSCRASPGRLDECGARSSSGRARSDAPSRSATRSQGGMGAPLRWRSKRSACAPTRPRPVRGGDSNPVRGAGRDSRRAPSRRRATRLLPIGGSIAIPLDRVRTSRLGDASRAARTRAGVEGQPPAWPAPASRRGLSP